MEALSCHDMCGLQRLLVVLQLVDNIATISLSGSWMELLWAVVYGVPSRLLGCSLYVEVDGTFYNQVIPQRHALSTYKQDVEQL